MVPIAVPLICKNMSWLDLTQLCSRMNLVRPIIHVVNSLLGSLFRNARSQSSCVILVYNDRTSVVTKMLFSGTVCRNLSWDKKSLVSRIKLGAL